MLGAEGEREEEAQAWWKAELQLILLRNLLSSWRDAREEHEAWQIHSRMHLLKLIRHNNISQDVHSALRRGAAGGAPAAAAAGACWAGRYL